MIVAGFYRYPVGRIAQTHVIGGPGLWIVFCN
jgi:hypothetical protein